ncbi:MAG: hypothetical protein WBA25_04110, partial [Jannaschia sp.]
MKSEANRSHAARRVGGAISRDPRTRSAFVQQGAASAAGLAVVMLALGSAPARSMTIDALIQTDDLGYSCIQEASLEAAFAAAGKAGRIPQTCIPEPCAEMMETEDLAMYIGMRPEEEMRDEYVARYADSCVAETGAPWGDALDISDIQEVAFRPTGPIDGIE